MMYPKGEMEVKNMFSQNLIYNKYSKNIEIRLLVTPYQNKKIPVYDWYNYKHSFSRDLVIKLVEKFHLNNSDIILDPFCGSGTTLLASKEREIPAFGIDILPLSVFVSNSKLLKYDKTKIQKTIDELKIILGNCSEYQKIDDKRKNLLIKFFPEDILNKILFIREWIYNKGDKEIKSFFLTALFSILENISYTRKDGAFLRILEKKEINNFESLYLSRLNKMYKDIDIINNLPSTSAKAIECDARSMPFEPDSFSALITSPPYPNRHDYTRVYLLELIIGFLNAQDKIKTLRYNSIRSHVEARKRFLAEDYHTPNILENILKRLREKNLPNMHVIKMLEGYFEDMHLVFKEIKRVLKSDSQIAFVIGDVRYGGIKIPVGNILIEIGNKMGIRFKEKITARVRGNSPQQMKKYGKDAVEENIIIWETK